MTSRESPRTGGKETDPMPCDPASVRALVRQGWDGVSEVYRPPSERTDRFGHREREYRSWLRPIFDSLPPRARVLELGCGCGVPASQLLAKKYRLTGVDLSPVQIARARELLPGSRFMCRDMTAVRFPRGSFEAVVALYSIIHVPLPAQRPLFRRARRWLAPGGLFLAILGENAYTGTEKGWLGTKATMYWSHTDASTYARWFEEDGFQLLRREFVPEDDVGHALFLLRTPRRGAVPGRRRDRSRLNL